MLLIIFFKIFKKFDMSKFVKIFSVIVDLLVSVLPVFQSLSKSKDDEKK